MQIQSEYTFCDSGQSGYELRVPEHPLIAFNDWPSQSPRPRGSVTTAFRNEMTKQVEGYVTAVDVGIGAFELVRGLKLAPATQRTKLLDEWRGVSLMAPFPFKHSTAQHGAPQGRSSKIIETLLKVNELCFKAERDEFGPLRPSLHAASHCNKLLLLLDLEGHYVAPADVSSDRDGGIRITWSCSTRETELVCPSDEDERPYIYFSDSVQFGADEDITIEGLIRWITWAMEH